MVDLSRVRRSGALAPLTDGFAAALTEAGYTPHGAIKQLHLFVHLSRWLDAEGLALADLDGEAIRCFFAGRREAGHTKLLSPRAAEPLLAYLRAAGVVPPAAPRKSAGPVDDLLVDYRRYL
ncbi:MAG: site-specific integrase, partial [Solirubrobacteraceae bacterium]